MRTSCFFFESLLSEFVDGYLPTLRHDELRTHLEGCNRCRQTHLEVKSTLNLVQSVSLPTVDPALAVKSMEASRAGLSEWKTKEFPKWAAYTGVSLCFLFALPFVFPRIFHSLSPWHPINDAKNFSRYTPLSQGAMEVLEDQLNWLELRLPSMRSIWEEGGMSPEEFEKAFNRQ